MGNEFSTPLSSPPAGPFDPPAPAASASDLTSPSEIDRLFSSLGVDLRTDDGSEDTIIQEIIDAASETIASFTLRYYNTADLVSSTWVRRRATIIACYYLSMRRGNPSQFKPMYDQIIEELERFLTSNPPFIPEVAVRTSNIPTVSDYIVDDRNRYRKLRVKRDYSTKPYPAQYPYYQPPYHDYH